MKFQQVYAVVDSEYRLLWVGGEWDEFALQNAAQHALANHVLSTSLMSHIAGDETRQLVARLVETVLRTKRPLRVEYRCDLPSVARAYLLTIQPMKEERALMVHDLKDAWHFSPPLNMWHYDPNSRDCKCSFCGNIRFGGRRTGPAATTSASGTRPSWSTRSAATAGPRWPMPSRRSWRGKASVPRLRRTILPSQVRSGTRANRGPAPGPGFRAGRAAEP